MMVWMPLTDQMALEARDSRGHGPSSFLNEACGGVDVLDPELACSLKPIEACSGGGVFPQAWARWIKWHMQQHTPIEEGGVWRRSSPPSLGACNNMYHL